MYTTERTLKALTNKINDTLAKGETEFTITIKTTGDKVNFSLCTMGDYNKMKTVKDVEYYLVSCRFPWFGGSDLKKIANDLNNWENLIADSEADKKALQEYKNKNCINGKWKGDSFDFYSDWHKDIFGYRPR